jgi:SAM-dependent methyltransferase
MAAVDRLGRVADLGCGWGLLGRLLLSRWPGARIDGYDLDEDTVRAARHRAGADGLRGRLTFTVADATDLDGVRSRSYDLVVAQAVLVHQSRPEQLLAEARRLLRPGGRAVLIEPDVREAFDIFDPVPADGTDPWPEILRGALLSGAGDWTLAPRLDASLREAGFADARLRRHPGRHRLPGGDPAAQGLRDHLLAREDGDEEAHLEMLGTLHRAGGGSAADWAEYSVAVTIARAARLQDLRADQHRIDRWGALYVAVATAPTPREFVPV